jgi:hypothetical protein
MGEGRTSALATEFRDGTSPWSISSGGPRLGSVSGGIFLLRGEGDLVTTIETTYDGEDVLQALLRTPVWQRSH